MGMLGTRETSIPPMCPEWGIDADDYNPSNDAQALILFLRTFHLSDSQIGDAIGMSRFTIGRLRHDRREAHPSTIEALHRLAQSVTPYPLAASRLVYQREYVTARERQIMPRTPQHATPARIRQERPAPDRFAASVQQLTQRLAQQARMRPGAPKHDNTPDAELAPAYAVNAGYFGRR